MKVRFAYLVSFMVYIIRAVSAECDFPSYLALASLWTAEYTNRATLTVIFNRNLMTATECLSSEDQCIKYERKCKEEREKGKYVVEHRIKGRDSTRDYPEYLCMQFIQRAEYIVQFRLSSKLTHSSPDLCSEDQLILDHWPLFAPEMVQTPPIKCPLTGGYNMVIEGPGGGVCPDKLVVPRMESECEEGDGITFNFRHAECVHSNLKMKKFQHLECVASWDHAQYTFVIIRSHANDFEAWCMRIAKDNNNEIKTITLFMDNVCDPGSPNGHGRIEQTDNFLTIRLQKLIVSSVCANEFEGCDDRRFCEINIRNFCYRSCKQCKPEVDLCSFPEDETGVWLMDSHKGHSRINISAYELNIPHIGKFQCLARNVSNNENRTALLHVFDNGCFPRFACMEMIRSSTSVRQFRLGNRLNWPQFPIENVKKNVCKNNKFLTDIEVGNEEKTVSIPLQVLMLESSDSHYSTSCNLHEALGFKNHALYFHEGDQCSGCLFHNPSPRYRNRIDIVTVNCTNFSRRISLICLASFRFNENTRAVITGTDLGRNQKLRYFLCWVLTRFGKQSRLITLKPADCNALAVDRALESSPDGKKTIAMFDVKESPPNGTCTTLGYPFYEYPPFDEYTKPPRDPVSKTVIDISRNKDNRPKTEFTTFRTSRPQSNIGPLSTDTAGKMMVFSVWNFLLLASSIIIGAGL